MANAIDTLFQTVKKAYTDNEASVKRRMLMADIQCIEGFKRPDGMVNGEDLSFCRGMQLFKIIDGWSHNNVVGEDKKNNVNGGYSSFTFNADIGRYYKVCVEIRKSLFDSAYAIGFCDKKMYSSMEDDKFHGQPGDEAELPLLRHAIKTTFGVELPAVIDKSYGYYLWGTDYKVWSSTESVDVATLQCVVPK